MRRGERGITLIILVITVIVLLIITSIAIYYGNNSIKKAQLEELKTNMLLIEAKVKGYVEEVDHEMGVNPSSLSDSEKNAIRESIYTTKAGLQKVSGSSVTIPPEMSIDTANAYYLTEESLKNMGLEKLKNSEGTYVVVFDEANVTTEVYNTEGFRGKYSLTDIDNLRID